MRTKPLDCLFPRTRQGILVSTFMRPDHWWYLSALAKHLGVPPSSLQRELASLVEAGILRRRREGNRVYVQANSDCPFFADLRGLLAKTAGLVDVLRDMLRPYQGRIAVAFVYGSLARQQERPDSDVDLLVAGDIGLADLSPALRSAEERLGRAVNPTVYAPSELAKKFRAGHLFVSDVLTGEKLFILGERSDLERALESAARPASQTKSPRAGQTARRGRTRLR